MLDFPVVDGEPPSRSRRPRSAGGQGRRWRRPWSEQVAIGSITAIAGLVAAVGPGDPTVLAPVNVGARAIFAAAVTLAGSRARRWTWLILAAVAAAATSLSPDDVVLATAAGWNALVIAVVSALIDSRQRWLGALVGALGVTALGRLGGAGPVGLTALVTAAATGPMLWSAYRLQRRVVRRRIRTVVLAGAAVAALAGLGALISVLTGAGPAQAALRHARAGVDAAKAGDEARATAELGESRRLFAAADGSFGAWFARPARAVPLASQQIDALGRMSEAGSHLATVAAEVAGRADYRSLAVVDGRIDPDRIAALEAPLAEVHGAITQAGDAVAGVDRLWLAPPIRERFDELVDEVVAAEHETSVALDAVRVAPDLLGARGPRHYFVAFTTPSESRGLGGFMGNWAELTVDDGRLDLTRSGRTADLVPRGRDPERTLVAPPDYLARYGPNRPDTHPQDLTLSPDFPSVAAAMASVYPQTRMGRPIDGVVALDPYTLAAMLRLTGPVVVPGLAEPLSAGNAADYLLRRQYVEFGAEEERVDVLDDASRLAFEAFITHDGLKPAQLGAALGPMVDQRRLLLHSRHAGEQALFERLGADGAFWHPGESDFVAVVTHNGGNNKIDTFLRRDVTYRARWDPGSGGVEIAVTVRLRNEAPATGLPRDVIVNRPDSGQPPGVNWLWFNLYSLHDLEAVTVDGQPFELNRASELGVNVYHRYLAIPPGGERTVEARLRGTGTAGARGYALAWYQQPLVHPDTVDASVESPPGWALAVRRAPGGGDGRRDGWIAADASEH
jgi:hypothetical protein